MALRRSVTEVFAQNTSAASLPLSHRHQYQAMLFTSILPTISILVFVSLIRKAVAADRHNPIAVITLPPTLPIAPFSFPLLSTYSTILLFSATSTFFIIIFTNRGY